MLLRNGNGNVLLIHKNKGNVNLFQYLGKKYRKKYATGTLLK